MNFISGNDWNKQVDSCCGGHKFVCDFSIGVGSSLGFEWMTRLCSGHLTGMSPWFSCTLHFILIITYYTVSCCKEPVLLAYTTLIFGLNSKQFYWRSLVELDLSGH